MYGGNLYTDSSKCYIDYRKKVCEENLAPYFVEYLRLTGAYMLCHQITGDTNLEHPIKSASFCKLRLPLHSLKKDPNSLFFIFYSSRDFFKKTPVSFKKSSIALRITFSFDFSFISYFQCQKNQTVSFAL